MYNPGPFPCKVDGTHPHLKMSEPPSYLYNLILADGEAGASMGVLMVALKLGMVLILVAVNGFFVAAEFALVGVRRSRIETLAAAGKSSAKRLLGLLDNLNAYLSASQLGITLASLGLGWVGEPLIARMLEVPLSGFSDAWRHGIAFTIAFAIIPPSHRSGDQSQTARSGGDERVALARRCHETFYGFPGRSRSRLGRTVRPTFG